MNLKDDYKTSTTQSNPLPEMFFDVPVMMQSWRHPLGGRGKGRPQGQNSKPEARLRERIGIHGTDDHGRMMI